MTKDVIKALYDISVRISAGMPATLPRAGSMPRPARRQPAADDTREPVTDMFDEGDRLIVVVQLPGIEQRAAQWSFRDARHLTIRAVSADRNFLKELELSAAVDEPATTSSFANGIMEITLWKRR